ncbi:MAG: glycosyltransferase family 39 protein [Actinobacteria bacterium]|nr:glycosyltransferase family 39 protein [Actinomycetota bacterium]
MTLSLQIPEATGTRATAPASSSRLPPVLRRHWGAVAVVFVFVLSRVAIHAAGVRFDVGPFFDGYQVLDRLALRDDLVTSIVNLHVQPPLFNLFVGLGLQLPDGWVVPFFHTAYLAFGLGLALGLYRVLRRLGVGNATAVVLASGFVLSPSVFLYEYWAHYDYPVTFLVCMSVLALQRYMDRYRARDAALFFALVAALVLTRSLFHFLWFLVLVFALILHRRQTDWRRVATAAAVPVLVVLGVQLHRFVAFGATSTSTMIGMNLARITVWQLPHEEREAMVARGELSGAALIGPLNPPTSYRGLVAERPPTGVAVLDEQFKPPYEDPPIYRTNFNSLFYADVSKLHEPDALHVLRERPGAYLRGVATAFNVFFRPSSDFFVLGGSRSHVETWDRLYNFAVLGVVQGGTPSDRMPDAAVHYREPPGRTAWFVVAAYLVALAGGAVVLWRRAIGRRAPGPPTLVLAFLWSTIGWITLVSNLVEVGENNRFRLYADPLALALVAALVVMWRGSRRHRRDPLLTTRPTRG